MTHARHVLTVVAIVAIAGATAAPATAGGPIGPDQPFVGEVNGTRVNAVVKVICPGPSSVNGAPVAGQQVSVAPSAALSGPGFTGTAAKRIVVRFAADPSIAMKVVAYDSPVEIPNGLRLPCSGTGKVRFVPRPTSATARSDSVTVSFENVGAV